MTGDDIFSMDQVDIRFSNEQCTQPLHLPTGNPKFRHRHLDSLPSSDCLGASCKVGREGFWGSHFQLGGTAFRHPMGHPAQAGIPTDGPLMQQAVGTHAMLPACITLH